MFAKNLKHEMKATARVLVPLLACVLILGIVLGLAFAGIGMLSNIGDASADVGGNASPDTGSSQLDFSNPVDVIAFIVVITFIFLVIAFFVMMIVCSVAVFVLMVRRFYTSFFTDEGYLTFTLPVTVDCHLMTKTASMVIWSAISSAVTLLAFGAFVLGIYFFAPEEFVMDEYSKLYFEALWREIGNVFGGSIAFGIINVIISGISSYLLLFFSISVGCMLTKKNRFIVCAASYLIINGVVNNIISIGTDIFSFIFVGMAMNESMYDLYMMTVILISTLLYAAQGVGCYFGTRWILKNKINLD
jgi:hypothetical protein